MAEAIKGYTYQYANIAASYGAILATGGCYLGKVIVNKVGSADFTITIYDGTSAGGTKVATLVNPAVGMFSYDCILKTGLYVTVAASTYGDITVTYDPWH